MTNRLLPACILAATCLIGTAQDGSNDPTFNTADVGFGRGMGTIGIPDAIVLQTDGKILVGGVIQYNGVACSNLVRINPDGSQDTGFNIGTGGSDVNTVHQQPDGKILVGGGFTTFNGVARSGIVRLNEDGSVDPTFNPGSGLSSGTVHSMALQSDGKIVIGGNFLSYNGTARNNIARLNSNGSLDTGFDPGSGTNGEVNAVLLQPDGKILLGGSFTTYNNASRNRLVRINTNGSMDAGHDPGTGASSSVACLALQADGKVIIGGFFTSYNGSTSNHIARTNSNGSLDPGFTPGTGANSAVRSVCLQPDGKILAGGEFTAFNGGTVNYVVRLNTTGTMDPSFTSGADGMINRIALLGEGRMLLAGNFTSYGGLGYNHLARVNDNGTIDAGFNPGSGVNGYPTAVAVQQDGRILIGGGFSGFNGPARKFLARLLPDGNLDASYDALFTSGAWISAITIQPDGKALVGGQFWTVNGISRNGLVRLSTDGSLDLSFDPGSGTSGSVDGIVLQPDGKILICGQFTTFGGAARNRIARLQPNGSLDGGFEIGSGANQTVRNVLLRPDGKIIAVGSFTTFNGLPRGRLVQLNTDGSVDPLVDFGSGADGSILAAALQSNGKILIAGWFTSVNGTPRNKIARLNQDGTLDSSFDPGTGLDQPPNSIVVQPDGMILIGGHFNTYNGVFRNKVARLNSNGDVDPTFDPLAGPNGAILEIASLPDGKQLLGGQFISYNGTGRNNIARIYGTPRVAIKLMLEGPYSGTTMTDALRTLPDFPVTEPFSAMGYANAAYTPGAAIAANVLATTGNNAIVDWVIVEMRPVATPNVISASRAVLLQRDGDVVDLDGVSTVSFSGLATGSYCVAVRPRNHLPVMLATTAPVNYTGNSLAVDFTLPGTPVYDSDARKNVGGVQVLAAGDVTFNGTISYTGDANDRDPILTRVGGVNPTATLSGYWREDVNMDGVVKYTGAANDRDLVLLSVGGVIPTNTRVATLP